MCRAKNMQKSTRSNSPHKSTTWVILFTVPSGLLLFQSMNALAVFLENTAPAEGGIAMITCKLPELLMNSQMVHRSVALLLEAGVARLAFKRASSLMNSSHVFVEVKLLREGRWALLA